MIVLAQTKPIGRLNITNDDIERKEAELLRLPQVEAPLVHRFAPGVYWRQIFMTAGSFIIGHEHKTTHFNVVLTGRASVLINGEVHEIVAPCVIKSDSGVRKVLFIHEDMTWATVHPTHETDLVKLEEELIVKSPSFQQYENEMKTLKDALEEKGVEL